MSELEFDKNLFEVKSNENTVATNYPQLQCLLNAYSNVFDGIGCLDDECHIFIDRNVAPIVCPPRRIPFVIQEKVKLELDYMVKNKIIEPINYRTDWVNAIAVAMKKNGKIRLFLDPRPLNKAIKRQHYALPTFEDIVSKVAGAKCFSILEARSGYWHIKLDNKSTNLTTFNTIFGKYRFLRMPFGLNVSQDIFQRKIEEALHGLPNHGIIIDDILLWANSKDEMLKNLCLTLQRCQERGIKLNLEKCQFMVSEVKYFGHVKSVDGIKPDPQKIQGLHDFPTPKCKADIQSLLGMINYLRKFSIDIAELTTPLRDLLKHDEWKWNEEHTQCFKNEHTQSFKNGMMPLLLPINAYSFMTHNALYTFRSMLLVTD